MKALILLTAFAGLAGVAFGQLTAQDLRTKYGAPLSVAGSSSETAEIFTLRPGLIATFDYGSHHQVCRIQLPSRQAAVPQIS